MLKRLARRTRARLETELWIEADRAGHLSIRCSYCPLNEYAPTIHSAFLRLLAHALVCPL